MAGKRNRELIHRIALGALLLFPVCALHAKVKTLGDYDGDGKTDVAVFRPSTGMWYLQTSQRGLVQVGWGQSGDIPVSGDFNGDGLSDVALFRPSNGIWYIRQSNGPDIQVGYGQPGDIPVPGDYDGNGITDVAVFRPSTGLWYLNTQVWGTVIVGFGMPGDLPVPGDYNADGITDVAVFRPSNGMWYIRQSNGVIVRAQFGTKGDIPAPSDYDGDGYTDMAVLRPSTGLWYVQNRIYGLSTIGGFGQSGDIPVPGDYDGDGANDIAVFRPSTGGWLIRASSGPVLQAGFGQGGDLPPSWYIQSIGESVSQSAQGSGGSFPGNSSFNISGQVLANGTPLAGVTLQLSGSAQGKATTDANGNYSITQPTGGEYMLTPTLPGYSFDPAYAAFTTSDTNKTASFSSRPLLLASENSQSLTSLEITGGDHAYFIDAQQHVRQFYGSRSTWVTEDLTAQSGNQVLAARSSALASLLNNNIDHVYYFDPNGHINQLNYTGSGKTWLNQDLTNWAQARVAAPGSAITACLYGTAGQVFYVDKNRHIGHLWWWGQGWAYEDLTNYTQAPTVAAVGSGLNSYSDVNNQLHLYYIDANQHITHMWWNTRTWLVEDLTNLSHANTLAALNGTLNGGWVYTNGSIHLFYFDNQPHVREMFWDTQRWGNADLTAETRTPAIPDPSSGLTSFAGPNGTAFLYYVDTRRHVNQMAWNYPSWSNQDITAASSNGAVLVGPQSALASMYVTSGNQVYYAATDGHVHQIAASGAAWVDRDVASLGGGPSVAVPTAAPTREYIYVNAQVIATENASH